MSQVFSAYTAVAYFSAVEARGESDAVASLAREDVAAEVESISAGAFNPYYPDLLALAANSSVSLINMGTGRQIASIYTGPVAGVAWVQPQRRLFAFSGSQGLVGPGLGDDPVFLAFFAPGEQSVSLLNVSEVVRRAYSTEGGARREAPAGEAAEARSGAGSGAGAGGPGAAQGAGQGANPGANAAGQGGPAAGPARGEAAAAYDSQPGTSGAAVVGVVYKIPMPYPVTDLVSQAVVNKVSMAARCPSTILHDGSGQAYKTVFGQPSPAVESVQAGYMSFAAILQDVVIIVSLLPPVDADLGPESAWAQVQLEPRSGPAAPAPAQPPGSSDLFFPYHVRTFEFRVRTTSLTTRVCFRFSPSNPNVFYALSGPLLFVGQLSLREPGQDERTAMERRREALFKRAFPQAGSRTTVTLSDIEKQTLFASTYVGPGDVCGYDGMHWKACYSFAPYFPPDSCQGDPQYLSLNDDGTLCALCGQSGAVLVNTETLEPVGVLRWPRISAQDDLQFLTRARAGERGEAELDALLGPAGGSAMGGGAGQPGGPGASSAPGAGGAPGGGDSDSDSDVADLDFSANPFTAGSSTDDPNELYSPESYANSVSASLVADDDAQAKPGRHGLAPEEEQLLEPFSLVTNLKSGQRSQPALDLLLHYPHVRPVLLEIAGRYDSLLARPGAPAFGAPSQPEETAGSGPPPGVSFKGFVSLALRQSFSFSPDDRYLIAASANGVGELVIWDLGAVHEMQSYQARMRSAHGGSAGSYAPRAIPEVRGELAPFSFLEQNSLERRTFAAYVPGTQLFVLTRGPMVVVLCPLVSQRS